MKTYGQLSSDADLVQVYIAGAHDFTELFKMVPDV